MTVKIDGIAASAASVIAMAGTRVLMSPVSMLMIHNPMTVAMGDTGEMQKAIEMLSSVKDSIINAYEIKTGLSRAKLSHLMDAETWMDAGKAVELGFADEVMKRPAEIEDTEPRRSPCCIPKRRWSIPSWTRSPRNAKPTDPPPAGTQGPLCRRSLRAAQSFETLKEENYHDYFGTAREARQGLGRRQGFPGLPPHR